MYFKVAEMSEILGISKVSIYNRLKTLKRDLKPFIQYEKNVLMLDNEGLEILKESFGLNKEVKSDFKQQSENEDNTKVGQDLNMLKSDTLFTVLNEQIEFLKKQIDVKDQQLINMQILLKQEQEQKLLPKENIFTQDNRTEEHFKNIDERLSKLQDQMNEIALTKQEGKKGIFKKIFS